MAKRKREVDVVMMRPVKKVAGHANRFPVVRDATKMTSSSELKVADIASAAYVADTTGSVTLLAVPILGSDMTNRIGRKIRLKSVYLRGTLQRESYAVGDHPATNCRLILVHDKQPNGAAPAITDILTASTSVAHLNLNNRDRFAILKDKIWSLDPFYLNQTANNQYSGMGRTVAPIKIFKKLDLEVIFNATNGGTIADINSGALLLVTIGSTADGGSFTLSTRVRYVDS